jgi:O-succinylbenzoic acid--CoA ligase
VAIKRLNGIDASEAYYPLKDVTLGKDDRDCLTISSPITEGITLITNDIIEFQADGGFIWLGRYDNVINSGGIKIQLEETEEKIKDIMGKMGYPLPIMAGALSDEKLGQKLVLVVETNNPDKFLLEGFQSKLNEEMPRHKAPKQIYFTASLQYTHTGKIDRKATLASISKGA